MIGEIVKYAAAMALGAYLMKRHQEGRLLGDVKRMKSIGTAAYEGGREEYEEYGGGNGMRIPPPPDPSEGRAYY